MSQKRLKGMPRTSGKTRSQSGTVKTMAKTGINAINMALRECLGIVHPRSQEFHPLAENGPEV
jgi:hypothetical protein